MPAGHNGQVENQVGLVRERFFTPRLRFASYEELNARLLDRRLDHGRAYRHPGLRERTVADVFEDEKAAPMRLPTAAFNGFHAVTATVSKTLLVRFDYNKYSVAARAPGRPAEVHAYAKHSQTGPPAPMSCSTSWPGPDRRRWSPASRRPAISGSISSRSPMRAATIAR